VSFLEKIGLKQHNTDSNIPPPPPAPRVAQKDNKTVTEAPENAISSPPKPESTPPPKPISDNNIKDLPSRKPPEPASMKTDSNVPSKNTEAPLPELPKEESSEENNVTKDVPSSSEQKPVSQPQVTQEKQPAKKNLSREELRQAFDDVPPIKSSKQSTESEINDDAVKNFDVGEFVLPGEKNSDSEDSELVQQKTVQQKTQAPAQRQQPLTTTPELYISVDIYDNIQKRVKDLKSQVSNSAKDIDAILADRDKEDESFANFIKDLERIQEDLIKIDEDLFTQQ
jgi:hypothetical protein